MITVRAVRAGEQTPLRELRLRAIGEAPEAFGGTLAEELTRPDEAWSELAEGTGPDGSEVGLYVVIDAERWIGMAAGRWFERSRGIVQLWGMWVEPGRRGERIGERLVDAVRGWAAGRDARFLRLGVIEDSPAIRFYERLGFVDTGERKPLQRDPSITAVYMARPV
ncbi:MAG: GNAT family N-acetyltransferase [Solirubrobacteraceae bacterium]